MYTSIVKCAISNSYSHKYFILFQSHNKGSNTGKLGNQNGDLINFVGVVKSRLHESQLSLMINSTNAQTKLSTSKVVIFGAGFVTSQYER